MRAGQQRTGFERAQATTVTACIAGVRDVDNALEVERRSRVYVYHPYYYPYGPYWQDWYHGPGVLTGSDDEIASAIITTCAGIRWWTPRPFMSRSLRERPFSMAKLARLASALRQRKALMRAARRLVL